MPLDHISHVFRAIVRTRFLTFWKPIEKMKLSNPLYLQFKSKTLLNLAFWSDLAQVGEVRYIASSNILAVNNNTLKYI